MFVKKVKSSLIFNCLEFQNISAVFLEEYTVKVVEDPVQNHCSVSNDAEFGPVPCDHSIFIYFTVEVCPYHPSILITAYVSLTFKKVLSLLGKSLV